MAVTDKIVQLTKQLYPTGRAFKMPTDSNLQKLHEALAESEAQAYSDAVAILNSILPDNANFTVEDATQWERRLGLITDENVPLADRKLAIKRKLNHPGTIPARQHYLYLQGQLQASGFDVYVFENTSGISPIDAINVDGVGQFGDGQMGDFQFGDVFDLYSQYIEIIPYQDYQLNEAQMGSIQMGIKDPGGYEWKNKVVNSIVSDTFYRVLPDYTSTFFICGSVFGTFANVDAAREQEFRQLILKIKPTPTIAYLLINYI